MSQLKALLFDCDGVLVDTERNGHRVAFNRVFKEMGYPHVWDIAQYKELLKIAGGKERMRYFFDRVGWPEPAVDKDALIRELHRRKTDRYMEIVDSGELAVRPGVTRLIDEAIAGGYKLAVCSTSNERAVSRIIDVYLGSARKSRFACILAGDIVSKKKPDPGIYLLAAERMHIEPAACCVIEDSRNGLLAAKNAGMRCVVTMNGYTEDEDFSGADIVVPELGDPPHVAVTVAAIGLLFPSCSGQLPVD